MNQLNEYDTDFFSIFEDLWNGKWIIISVTLITTFIGVIFTLNKPNSFEVKSIIKKGEETSFINYLLINEIFKESRLLASDLGLITVDELNSFKINSSTIFNMFINEFNDYEEMRVVLSKNKFVNEQIKDLNKDEKNKALISYAKSFKIEKIPKNKFDRMLSFNWHSVDEGSNLINEAILLTLANVKINLENQINILTSSLDSVNKRKINKLKNQLILLEKKFEFETDQRVLILKEHSSIAKELGIDKNIYGVKTSSILKDPSYTNSKPTLSSKVLKKTKNNEFLSITDAIVPLKSKLNDFPYYLRGFKAIDKEILIIESRSEKQKKILTSGYIETIRQIDAINYNFGIDNLRNSLKIISNDNTSDWLIYNIALAEFHSLNKPVLDIVLSILSGGMLGSFFVLFRRKYITRKNLIRDI